MYDSFADSFAVHAEHSPYNAHYDRPAVLGLLGDVSGCRILDVGCGSGLYAAELARRGAHVTGFDSSAKLVQHARQRVGDAADLRVHDLHHPLGWLSDDSVDQAVMALVVHHLADPVPALREMHRVLRPGGRLVVSTVHPTADWRQLGGGYFTDEMVDDTWNEGWKVRFRQGTSDSLVRGLPGGRVSDRTPGGALARGVDEGELPRHVRQALAGAVLHRLRACEVVRS